MTVTIHEGDCLEVIPRLAAEGVTVETSFLDDAGILYDRVFQRGGTGERDRLGRLIRGEMCVALRCGFCGSTLERRLGEIRHLVTRRSSRLFFCNRKCKNSAESIAQTPPILLMPDYLQKSINTTNEIEQGKAAEHLVCAELILAGYRAYLSDQGLPYDIVVDIDGRLIRIQVKSTAQPKPIPKRKTHTPTYSWSPRRGGRGGRRLYGLREFDIVALVALDIRCIAYIKVIDILRQTIMLRPPKTPATHKNKRLKNIDEYSFNEAITELS